MATPESNPLDAAGPLEPSQPLAVARGSEIYNWVIEVNPEDENECPITKRFIGTRDQASSEGDRMADRADFDVESVTLHRRGQVFPNTAVSNAEPKS